MKKSLRLPKVVFLFLSSLFFWACDSSSETESVSSEAELKTDGQIKPEVGDLVPDFQLEDAQGRVFRLSQFEGSLVFLNFWATWCPPCIEELPSMDALNQRFKAKAFNMLAVSVDDSWAEISRFRSRLSRAPSFLILHDPEKFVANQLYGTEKFPETFIIGPDRRLLRKFEGSVAWTQPELVELLQGYIQSKTE